MPARQSDSSPQPERKKGQPTNRMPSNSVFYDRIVPLLLIGMGVAMAAMILFAAGVILGLIPFA